MLQQTKMLSRVREGSDVYDAHGKQIGTVKYVYSGGASPDSMTGLPMSPGSAPAIVPDQVDKILSSFHFEREVRERLLTGGFLVVDTGLLRADRLVVPEKIANVSENWVELTVSKDHLISL
jgi:hypothetical protein